MKEFMRRTGVTKRKYVENWLEKGLIPGVTTDPVTGEPIFPPSARRPYCPGCKPNADASTIRASMLKGCMKRHHISPEIYGMDPIDFLGQIEELKSAGLIRETVMDGITYYDTTYKCDKLKEASSQKIKKFILEFIPLAITCTEHIVRMV